MPITISKGVRRVEWVERFLSSLERQDKSSATLKSYRSDLTDFINWFQDTNGEPFNPNRVTPIDLREFKQHLLTKGAKASTINRKLSCLKSFFKWAQREGLVEMMPSFPQPVRTQPLTPRWLDKVQQNALLRAVRKEGKLRDIAIITMLLHTGLRVSELCQLRWEDIVLSDRKGYLIVRAGKGGKQRQVPLNREVRQVLRAYREKVGEPKEGFVFLGRDGEPLGARGVEVIVQKFARKAGLEGVTPHTLRHTFCHNLLRAGVDLVTVAALAGHESLTTTARYTQPSEREKEEAVERLVE